MTTGRTFFIDRLRVVLTALVILHHTAITYGGSGGWFLAGRGLASSAVACT
jgi:glucan biosynthesis protein C